MQCVGQPLAPDDPTDLSGERSTSDNLVAFASTMPAVTADFMSDSYALPRHTAC
jgi:hypothetical protein